MNGWNFIWISREDQLDENKNLKKLNDVCYTKYDMELYYAIKIYVQGHLNGDCEIMSYAAKNS